MPTGWCGMASPLVAELIAREGYPCVTLDQQHGCSTCPRRSPGSRRSAPPAPPPWCAFRRGAFSVASRVLDAGAEGIVAPMINTIEDAKAFVAATKFPPIGGRSWGPARASQLSGVEGSDYLKIANDAVVTFAMIETRMAIKNVDAILGMPGIDAAFVGPSDLSITLTNGRTLDPHSKEVDKAIDTIAEAAKKAGKFAAAYAATPERALELEQRGFRFFAIASDTAFLRAGASGGAEEISVDAHPPLTPAQAGVQQARGSVRKETRSRKGFFACCRTRAGSPPSRERAEFAAAPYCNNLRYFSISVGTNFTKNSGESSSSLGSVAARSKKRFFTLSLASAARAAALSFATTASGVPFGTNSAFQPCA